MLTPNIAQYDRLHLAYAGTDAVDGIVFTGPDGAQYSRPSFLHQPTDIVYDDHGYERITPAGIPISAARFTPPTPGTWRYNWQHGTRAVGAGSFTCTASAHPGYVEISRRDPRYFAYTNGDPYVALGLNLCGPVSYALSTGEEFKTGSGRGTLGAREYARWFQSLAANGGNFARLWLGIPYFQVDGEVAGELDLTRFAAIDAAVALARTYDIRLKLCLEYFRTFQADTPQSRVLRHPADGRPPASMDEWFTEPTWQELWWHKVDALLARYGDDPVVMAWELWNEIDCCATRDFAVQESWTQATLRRVKAAAPRNLVTNSLGSFDWEPKQAVQDAFTMPEMDVQQVHRYLDQGAGLAICRTDPVALAVDAVSRTRRPDHPLLLAETGAVNDCHSGPFRYYRADHDGLIFHDTTYPAFFAGAAGSGHIWHWDGYVDTKNLWYGYRALTELLHGVAVDREAFQAAEHTTDTYHCLLLRGTTCTLGWLRNRADRWDTVLRDGHPALPISNATLDLAALGLTATAVTLYYPWQDGEGEAVIHAGRLSFPPFTHGLVFRVLHAAPEMQMQK